MTTNGTTAGYVGNNPNTAWADHDAYASCMVLNQDYRNFPSPPLKSLQATAAHEFNHGIQFGEGGLTGVGAPDLVFTEGGATWMEDEVFDTANDNYFYLWPPLEKSMGEFGSGNDVYSYWLTFRAMTEQFGTGVAGGGEDVMQQFWESTSRETANNLNALDAGLALKSEQPARRVPRGRHLDPLREDVRRRIRVPVLPRGGRRVPVARRHLSERRRDQLDRRRHLRLRPRRLRRALRRPAEDGRHVRHLADERLCRSAASCAGASCATTAAPSRSTRCRWSPGPRRSPR